MQYSQTQLANLGALAGIIVIILSKFGVTTSTDEVVFIIGSVITIGSTIYNAYNRWKKGDIVLGVFRK